MGSIMPTGKKTQVAKKTATAKSGSALKKFDWSKLDPKLKKTILIAASFAFGGVTVLLGTVRTVLLLGFTTGGGFLLYPDEIEQFFDDNTYILLGASLGLISGGGLGFLLGSWLGYFVNNKINQATKIATQVSDKLQPAVDAANSVSHGWQKVKNATNWTLGWLEYLDPDGPSDEVRALHASKPVAKPQSAKKTTTAKRPKATPPVAESKGMVSSITRNASRLNNKISNVFLYLDGDEPNPDKPEASVETNKPKERATRSNTKTVQQVTQRQSTTATTRANHPGPSRITSTRAARRSAAPSTNISVPVANIPVPNNAPSRTSRIFSSVTGALSSANDKIANICMYLDGDGPMSQSIGQGQQAAPVITPLRDQRQAQARQQPVVQAQPINNDDAFYDAILDLRI